MLHTKTETSQQLAKARSCASRNLGLGGRHPCMMRSAWERVNARTSTASASHRFGWRDRARSQRRHAWTQRHHLPQNRSRWLRLRLNGFACVHIGTRVLACFFLVIICERATHFIVTWRQTTASLSGTSCDAGANSGATRPPRQGRNKTLRSFMSTACRRHPLRNIFSSLLHTSTACAVQPTLFCFKNGTFDGVADIDCAVDRVASPSTHIFWMPGYATRFKNFRKYSISHGKLTLVMPTGTALHVRPMIAQIFHEFAMMCVRDTHPRSS